MVNAGQATSPTIAESRPRGPAFRTRTVPGRSIRAFLFLVLLVDLGFGRLRDAHRVRSGHRFLQALLKLPLHCIFRLLVAGRVFDVRVATALFGRGNGHGTSPWNSWSQDNAGWPFVFRRPRASEERFVLSVAPLRGTDMKR